VRAVGALVVGAVATKFGLGLPAASVPVLTTIGAALLAHVAAAHGWGVVLTSWPYGTGCTTRAL
jgi:hypothetical protein